jgi:hypothetical protein
VSTRDALITVSVFAYESGTAVVKFLNSGMTLRKANIIIRPNCDPVQ